MNEGKIWHTSDLGGVEKVKLIENEPMIKKKKKKRGVFLKEKVL